MIKILGTYKNGTVNLDQDPGTSVLTSRVIVSFPEEEPLQDMPDEQSTRRLSLSDFSFQESRKLLKNLRSSLRDAVIEERRSDL